MANAYLTKYFVFTWKLEIITTSMCYFHNSPADSTSVYVIRASKEGEAKVT